MEIVYVKETVGLDTDGGTVTLRRGDAWDAESTIVKAHPHLFEDAPAKVHGRVERATRAPGEQRDVAPRPARKRAAKKAAKKAPAKPAGPPAPEA